MLRVLLIGLLLPCIVVSFYSPRLLRSHRFRAETGVEREKRMREAFHNEVLKRSLQESTPTPAPQKAEEAFAYATKSIKSGALLLATTEGNGFELSQHYFHK